MVVEHHLSHSVYVIPGGKEGKILLHSIIERFRVHIIHRSHIGIAEIFSSIDH